MKKGKLLLLEILNKHGITKNMKEIHKHKLEKTSKIQKKKWKSHLRRSKLTTTQKKRANSKRLPKIQKTHYETILIACARMCSEY